MLTRTQSHRKLQMILNREAIAEKIPCALDYGRSRGLRGWAYLLERARGTVRCRVVRKNWGRE